MSLNRVWDMTQCFRCWGFSVLSCYRTLYNPIPVVSGGARNTGSFWCCFCCCASSGIVCASALKSMPGPAAVFALCSPQPSVYSVTGQSEGLVQRCASWCKGTAAVWLRMLRSFSESWEKMPRRTRSHLEKANFSPSLQRKKAKAKCAVIYRT